MDDVLEGVLQYAVKELLKVLILTKNSSHWMSSSLEFNHLILAIIMTRTTLCNSARKADISGQWSKKAKIRFSFLVFYYGTILLTVTEQHVSPEYKNIQMHVDNCSITRK